MNPATLGINTPTPGEAPKFPQLHSGVELPGPDEWIERLREWITAALFYQDLYPNQHQDVTDMIDAANEIHNRPQPANPEFGLAVPQANYDDIVRRLRNKTQIKIKFDLDTYQTRFRKVGDDIVAYDPDHPEGRKVRVFVPNSGENSVPLSKRAILAACLDPEQPAYAMLVGRLIAEAIEKEEDYIPEKITTAKFYNVCIAAKIAHAHGIRITFSRGKYDVYAPATDREGIQSLMMPMAHVSHLLNSVL